MRRLLTVLLSFITFGASAQTTQLLGGPGIKVLNRGDFQADSIFYLPRTLVTSRAPSQAGALRYQASDSTLYQWTGTAWRRITGEAIDTLLISTRAWRQKGDDSLGNLIGLRVRFTDTSSMLTPYLRKVDTTAMLTPYVRTAGYGLTKGTQTLSVDTGLMATRVRVQKAIDSLAATEVSGSGTVNRVAKFTASGTVGNGSIADSSSSVAMTINSSNNVGIGIAAPTARLHLQGSGNLLRVQGAGAQTVFETGSATDGRIEFSYNSTRKGLLNIDADHIRLQAEAGNYLDFYSGGAQRMRLTSAGRLLVGTTTEGTNTVDIAGTLRSTQGANFATSSGNVGIRTTTPVGILDIANLSTATLANGLTFTAANLPGADNGHRIGLIYSGDNTIRSSIALVFENLLNNFNSYITLGTGPSNTERMRITSGGNVGIGTTSPAEKLDVVSSTGSNLFIRVNETAGGQAGIKLIAGQATTNRATRIDFMNAVASTTVARWTLINDYNQDGTNDFTIVDASNIRRFTILQGGNVGIGTSSPSEALHVVGRGRFTTIDSTSSPINLLTSDVNGVIRKTSIAASGGVTGSGTASRIPVFTSSTAIGNSNIYVSANGAGFGLNDANPTQITNYGILNLGGSAGAVQYFKIADTIRGYFGMAAQTIGQPYTTSVLEITNSTSGDIRFTTSSSEKVRLKNDGELVLGSVSTDAGNYRLQVNGSQYVSSSMNIANATVFDANNKLEIYGPAFIRNTATAGSFRFDSTAAIFVAVQDRAVIAISGGSHTGSNAGPVLSIDHTWNTSGDVNLIRADVTNTASGSLSNFIRLSDGTNTFRVNKSAEIFTSAPTGGTSKGWRLGDVSVVSPTSPNRTLRVEVDGTVYYIHAKTTND